MSGTDPFFCASDIHVWRGERHLLKGVCFELRAGELLHVRGQNGVGKTTLLRVAAGLIHPEIGEVRWGSCLLRDAEEFHASMVYAAHETALKADLTVLENLHYSVGLKRDATRAQLRQALQATGSLACEDLPVRVLSAGQRRRVAMARVIAMQARLWLLDEPSANLDADGAAAIAQLLEGHLRSGGMAIVIAHHALDVRAATRFLDLEA